jgi:hypothetical protein
MKRTIVIGLFGLGAAALLGCPVWGGGGGGECGGGECPAQTYCTSSDQCPGGYTCEDNECVYSFPDSGLDVDAPSGDASDCSTKGCPTGQVCSIVGGAATCVPNGDGATESGPPPFTGCTSNSQCSDSGVGALCLDGVCTSEANECSDATQCLAGEDCVQGACVPTCSSSMPCPSGYSCTTIGDSGSGSGVCTGNPTPCGGADGGMTCSGDTTCVDQHCVPKCASGDAACSAGLVCVDDGCIPKQSPAFTCNTDGQAGDGKKGDCDVGSVCLHHSCYISCDPESGTSCMTADMFPICKPVTTGTGTYYVCGSSSNLGSQCDPTRGLNCTGSDICIDGYCR